MTALKDSSMADIYSRKAERLVSLERLKHLAQGKTPAKDLEMYGSQETLSRAAAFHALSDGENWHSLIFRLLTMSNGELVQDEVEYPFPAGFNDDNINPLESHSRLENLIIAGALIQAEIAKMLLAEEREAKRSKTT